MEDDEGKKKKSRKKSKKKKKRVHICTTVRFFSLWLLLLRKVKAQSYQLSMLPL